jgi:hypothetical protein
MQASLHQFIYVMLTPIIFKESAMTKKSLCNMIELGSPSHALRSWSSKFLETYCIWQFFDICNTRIGSKLTHIVREISQVIIEALIKVANTHTLQIYLFDTHKNYKYPTVTV